MEVVSLPDSALAVSENPQNMFDPRPLSIGQRSLGTIVNPFISRLPSNLKTCTFMLGYRSVMGSDSGEVGISTAPGKRKIAMSCPSSNVPVQSGWIKQLCALSLQTWRTEIHICMHQQCAIILAYSPLQLHIICSFLLPSMSPCQWKDCLLYSSKYKTTYSTLSFTSGNPRQCIPRIAGHSGIQYQTRGYNFIRIITPCAIALTCKTTQDMKIPGWFSCAQFSSFGLTSIGIRIHMPRKILYKCKNMRNLHFFIIRPWSLRHMVFNPRFFWVARMNSAYFLQTSLSLHHSETNFRCIKVSWIKNNLLKFLIVQIIWKHMFQNAI